jgi:hypothetical protein
MKHVTSLSKARPKQAFMLPDFSGLLSGLNFAAADTIFKTPEEKEAKKGDKTPAAE